MSRRRGQRPRSKVVGDKYIGRYRVDVPGSTKQVKKAVIIGSINEMTKPEADRKLLELIEREGVNTEIHLERSRRPAISFGDAARSWRDNHLNANKKPASKNSMGSELRNHILPHLDQMPFDEVNTYETIRTLVRKWQRTGLSTKSMKNVFTIVRAVYNFRLDEMAQAGTDAFRPWIVKWKRVNPVADIEEEQACFEEERMFTIVSAAEAAIGPCMRCSVVQECDLERCPRCWSKMSDSPKMEPALSQFAGVCLPTKSVRPSPTACVTCRLTKRLSLNSRSIWVRGDPGFCSQAAMAHLCMRTTCSATTFIPCSTG